MNERIKELIKQAGGHPNYEGFRGHFLPPPPDYIDPATVDLEKFANLIIQECVEICRKGINNATAWDSSYWDQACENRAETIQQHFGVNL